MSRPEEEPVPPNRWETHRAEIGTSYADRFTELIEAGTDIDGEARLADVLAPRSARILDAGSGIGRVAAALRARGHDVTAVEKDPDLVARSRRLFPEVPVVECDILGLSPAMLSEAGRPAAYDVVVVVGNVMIYLAEGTEHRALATLAALLAPGGRILVGFHLQQGPTHSRDYPLEEFRRHADRAGLIIEQHFGTFDLGPPSDEFVVAVLRPV
jgi:SAM-dependent methyltransferase